MLHIFVMKNLLSRFGKRDTASIMDLTYMEYLTAVLPINFQRLMIRHMSYVISMPQHELPYGANRRRDDNENAPTENVENVEVHNEENPEGNFAWEVVNEEANLQGKQTEEDAEDAESGSREKYYDAEDEERSADVEVVASEMVVPAPAILTCVLQKEKISLRVDPSRPSGSILDVITRSGFF
ncbi:hypothetical protein Dimus_010804 [Dionaea muscipula]